MQTFDTTTWIVQTMLLTLGIFLLIPIVRAIAGLGLMLIAQAFHVPALHHWGHSLVPRFIALSLGISAISGIAVPVQGYELTLPDSVEVNIQSIEHVVRPGESLWDIARKLHSNPAATAPEVDALWRELWQLNLTTIGEDPSTIPAGTRLILPVLPVASDVASE